MRFKQFLSPVASAALACAPLLFVAPLAKAAPADRVLDAKVNRVVQVRAMDLDVVARSDGKPVNDLKQSELEVIVDGRTFPLDYFTYVDAGSLHGPDLATASPDFILQTELDDRGDRFVPRQFLIYVDDVHLLPFERSRAIASLRDFIVRLTPSDRVLLLAYEGTGARVIVPFTSSKEQLLDGLTRLEGIAPAGLRWNTDFRNTVAEVRRLRRATRDGVIRTWGAQVEARERATLEDLRRAVAALSARSGKRALIYVSDGLELHPGETLADALGVTPLLRYERTVRGALQEVLDEANSGGVTLHAIDARGLVTEADASERTPSPFDAFFTSQTLREAPVAMTTQTGGVFVRNRNDFRAGMDRIYRESSDYYSIGITLSNLDPDRAAHKVKVVCKRPGVKVVARRSYVPRTSEQATQNLTELALLTPGAQGDFQASLTLDDTGERHIVPYSVTFPLSALTFTEQDGKHSADVQVTLAAVTDRGARSPIRSETETITIDAREWKRAKDSTFTYSGKLKTEKGNVRFVAAVRDVASDRVGIASKSLHLD